MSRVIALARTVVDGARNLLTGEPVRAIGYGAAAIIYLVARASGSIEDVTPEEALVQAGAAVAIVAGVVESIRRVVYSPNTVDGIVEELRVLSNNGDST